MSVPRIILNHLFGICEGTQELDSPRQHNLEMHSSSQEARKLPSHHFPTVLLLPTENGQSAPFFGAECALQPSVPVLRNATPSAGSICNFYRVSTPAGSSAWLLPSDSSTCCQQLMDRASLYQRAGTTTLTTLTEQNQISTLALPYAGLLQCDLTGSSDRRETAFQDFTVTIIDQNTTLSSLAMTAQGDSILDPNALVPLYPTLSASLVQATSSEVPNQGYNLAPSYQDGSQLYYYSLNSLSPLTAGELKQCLQAYGLVSYSGTQASSLQPEMVMMLKEFQPVNIQTPFSTSAFYCPTSAQAMPDSSLQVVEMEPPLELTPSGQTFCLLMSPDLGNACTHDNRMRTPPVSEDRSLTTLSPQSFRIQLPPLPPAPSLEQTENNNLDFKTARSYQRHLDTYEAYGRNLVLDNDALGNGSLGQEEPGVFQSVVGSNMDFADMTALMADIHLPQLFNSLTELNQFQDPRAPQSKDSTVIRRDQAQERSSGISAPSDQVRKNDQKVSELLAGAPQARIQLQKLVEGEEAVGSAGFSEGAFDNMAKHLEGKAQKVTPSKRSRAGAHGQDKAKKTRENNSKKTEELKPSNHRAKAEEKPTIPKTKRKRNPPELSHDSFKKPRTHLGMHMLESVQVFHPLGKKSEKKTGISSSRALLNFSSNKDPRTGPDTTSLLDMPREGQTFDKSLGKIQRPGGIAHKRCPSPSQYELPPPGKVKLVPLPFPVLDKPQAKPVSRKLLCLASRRPTVAYPVKSHSHSAQPPTLKSSQPAPATTSLMASDKPALPNGTSATRANITKPIQSFTGPQPAASRPAPYRASSHTSLHREPLSAARNKALSSPKAKTQYLLLDFSCQPIPWRKVDIPGPVISQPIPEEQRPEREAMKRRAQQERENAAKYTSLGKLQFFLQREKDMEISKYYGYAM
ncbi:LOW QUALITY PROTEIN: uncharacterized protein C2orf78 homolog [Arvicola amphibius]|uniref:LOW QUALITY PROTEIN: uncharacterized protein C2orf78 homolog n=1 Tax=Arvicola amphibius TaxID=1047088 RepID=UPI001C09E79F|nr:LOW QUALITY PROTEIN: uncharacterized protein C2orf78 homolog [Arvicola amphibius]